ncbi:MAG: ECF transporter S component [Pelosinus sp.]|nr:ECF transporter S component [Pelosinus sp.]
MIKRRLSTKDIILIGMLAALCAIATTLKVPLPTGAMVHLGTAAIFIIGIAFGGVYAGISGAIGSAFFDLLMGFSPYTAWSFVIKGVAGLIVGIIAKGLWPEGGYSGSGWLGKALFGCVLAAAWTLGGYILAWWQVLGSLAVALGNIPASLLTSGVGMIVALLLSPKIRQIVNRQM